MIHLDKVETIHGQHGRPVPKKALSRPKDVTRKRNMMKKLLSTQHGEKRMAERSIERKEIIGLIRKFMKADRSVKMIIEDVTSGLVAVIGGENNVYRLITVYYRDGK